MRQAGGACPIAGDNHYSCMTIVARCNSVVLVERGQQLVLIDQGGAGLEIVVFAGAIVTFVLGVNGIVHMLTMPWIAAAMLVLSALAGVAVRYTLRTRRRLHADLNRPVRMTFDLETKLAYDASGLPFAGFDEIRLRRRWQRHTSVHALILKCPSRSLVVARGSPFADVVDDIETTLLNRGIGRAPS